MGEMTCNGDNLQSCLLSNMSSWYMAAEIGMQCT